MNTANSRVSTTYCLFVSQILIYSRTAFIQRLTTSSKLHQNIKQQLTTVTLILSNIFLKCYSWNKFFAIDFIHENFAEFDFEFEFVSMSFTELNFAILGQNCENKFHENF